MEVFIQISGGDAREEVTALRAWLARERELQGKVRLVPATIGPEDLGGLVDVLSVALGSGGAGVALTHSLNAWLASRRSDVRLTVKSRGREVVLDAQRVKDVPALLREVLDGSE